MNAFQAMWPPNKESTKLITFVHNYLVEFVIPFGQYTSQTEIMLS